MILGFHTSPIFTNVEQVLKGWHTLGKSANLHPKDEVCLRTQLSYLLLLPSVVLDVEERVGREDVGLVLGDEHGGHPPDEELAALEGQRATEVRPLLVSHHALKHEIPFIT